MTEDLEAVAAAYEPWPIDTTHVTLDDGVAVLLERLAENVHDRWAKQRLAQGWRYGPARDDERKLHPCLIP